MPPFLTKALYLGVLVKKVTKSGNILFSIMVGVMLGDALPSLATTFGIVLIIFAGVMVAKQK